ncbi:GATA transcription factor 12 [Mercurialis annua]|uniref:GATA transcription factor 12 n=1 Tax=Mercurialis annua TaxID=3986 RepID=UPI0021604A0B|nr:GATA transcription factor 12 [Mercurialis annua]
MEAPQLTFSHENRHSFDSKPGAADHFMVEDLLDFSNDEDTAISDAFDNVTGNSADSSSVTVVDTCNSSASEPAFNAANAGTDAANFSNDLCVPYDDLAELEWLSNFVEESFSSEDLHKLQLISGVKTTPDESSETRTAVATNTNNNSCEDNHNNSSIFDSEVSVPAKARSKRSRAAPCNWASRLLLLSPTTSSLSEAEVSMGPTHHPNTGKKTVKASGAKRRDNIENGNNGGEGRKCLHCATDKTPQWRTGPMGPKTLCNACGVRYKSGRLVPEYRPAASPTFVLTKHSNSHRKVMELRRQKEVVWTHPPQHHQPYFHHHQSMVFDVPNGDDYLIHQHVGPDFRQLI